VADQINEENLTTFDWLSTAGNKEAWRQHAKQILDAEEMKECTFKPVLKNEKVDLQRSMMQANTSQLGVQPKYE
jgi:hypothetical protein